MLLYYKCVSIPDAQKVRDEQRELCLKFNLKGRIIVADEGINGAVEGLREKGFQFVTVSELLYPPKVVAQVTPKEYLASLKSFQTVTP